MTPESHVSISIFTGRPKALANSSISTGAVAWKQKLKFLKHDNSPKMLESLLMTVICSEYGKRGKTPTCQYLDSAQTARITTFQQTLVTSHSFFKICPSR